MATTEIEKDTVTFRIPTQKRTELDRVADGLLRDRSFVLNEAVDAYLDTKRWQIAHVEGGLKDAKAGRFASARDVERAYKGE
ncbi:MAG: CopG family transcriptional regulator [Patescibacteria group bacterium]